MKQKMTKILGLMSHGDGKSLAEQAKVTPSVLSDILNGKKDILSYPSVASVLREFINKREQEIASQEELNRQLDNIYKKIDIMPMTEDDLLVKRLTSVKIMRMSRKDLLTVIEKKALKISKQEIKDMDNEELVDEIIDQLNLKS
jgi:hypothetical protein